MNHTNAKSSFLSKLLHWEYSPIDSPNRRLGFMDAARGLAIILMLQGHFISLTFEDYSEMKAAVTSGESENLLFAFWVTLRGFTAPMFFGTTGLVFTFLLLRQSELPFWKQTQVKRGLKRGIEVIFWGYLLNFNLKNWHLYINGIFPDRTWTFHVLQSIGFSLLVMILFYAIARLIPKIRVSVFFLLVGVTMILLTPIFNGMGDQVFPVRAPQFIQNMFHGPNSVFPIFPWLGIVLLGGSVGAYLREKQTLITNPLLPLINGLLATGFFMTLWGAVNLWDRLYPNGFDFSSIGNHFLNFARFILILLVLFYLERFKKFRIPFFVEMGKNTLVIYILHAIILYGAVFGIGMRTFWENQLSLPQAMIGALLFILFFGLLTYVQNKFSAWRQKKKST